MRHTVCHIPFMQKQIEKNGIRPLFQFLLKNLKLILNVSWKKNGPIRILFCVGFFFYICVVTSSVFKRKTYMCVILFFILTKYFSWTRWCNQILSSLHYMHTLNTVHGNLTADTIFLQHHGLIKIGCFSIDTIRSYGKEPNNREPNKVRIKYSIKNLRR